MKKISNKDASVPNINKFSYGLAELKFLSGDFAFLKKLYWYNKVVCNGSIFILRITKINIVSARASN